MVESQPRSTASQSAHAAIRRSSHFHVGRLLSICKSSVENPRSLDTQIIAGLVSIRVGLWALSNVARPAAMRWLFDKAHYIITEPDRFSAVSWDPELGGHCVVSER